MQCQKFLYIEGQWVELMKSKVSDEIATATINIFLLSKPLTLQLIKTMSIYFPVTVTEYVHSGLPQSYTERHILQQIFYFLFNFNSLFKGALY